MGRDRKYHAVTQGMFVGQASFVESRVVLPEKRPPGRA